MGKKNEYNYFDVLIMMSENIVNSADILNNTLKNYNYQEIDNNVTEIHKLETDCDRMVHEFSNQLVKDFITPIDREDLNAIIHMLDDVEDNIDELLINFKILDITTIRKDIEKFTELIVHSANAVKEMFISFKNFKKIDIIKEKIIEINNIEDQGDETFEELMTNLYKISDPMEVIKWTKIYNGFENSIDSCERLGDRVSLTLLKNS